MLAFRVLPPGRPPAGSSTVVGDLQVEWTASAPFGFAYEFEGRLALGEAVAPVDEEVVRRLALEVELGTCTDLSDGVLGFALIDGKTGTATLIASVRSIRAYSYVLDSDGLVCATSLRALRDLGVTLAFDEERLGEYLLYRYISPPNTLCRGVRRLVGGQSLRIDLRQGVVTETRARPFPAAGHRRVDEDDVLERFEELCDDEVRRALGRGGRASVLFSGGLDSTVVALATRRHAGDARLLSTSFSFVDAEDQELDYARTAASHVGLDHEVYGGSKEAYLRGLVKAVDLAEEPLHHLQSVMLHLLYEGLEPSEGDLVLCGEGADGLWGNDAHVKLRKYETLLFAARRTGLQRLYRWILSATRVRSERLDWFARDFGPDMDDDRHVLWEIGAYGDIERVRSITGCTDGSIRASRTQLLQPYADMSLCERVSILSLLGEAGLTMRIWGGLAEARRFALFTPFTSPEMVDLAFRLPWVQKLSEPKHFVRAALRRDGVPEHLIERPKLGFGFSERHWSLPGTLFQPLVDLAAERWDASLLRSLQTGRSEDAMILWCILGLDLWQRLVLEDATPEALIEEVLKR